MGSSEYWLLKNKGNGRLVLYEFQGEPWDFMGGPSNGFLCVLRFIFLVCAIADRRHHSVGDHDERDMAMPVAPGTGFVMVEAELVPGDILCLTGMYSRSQTSDWN